MKTTRFLAVLVAVLMIATAAISVAAFSDVPAGHEYGSAIGTLTGLGVIGGYPDGTFAPDANVKRSEMAKMVFVLKTTMMDAGAGAVKFDDVAANHWAAGYVSWCSAKSIIGGFGDGTFKPEENVTYDQALKMVCAALGYTDFDSALWPTDVREQALIKLDLGKDIEAKGSDFLTRAQVAQLLYNALTEEMNETYTVNALEKYPQTELQQATTDVNGDGKVDAADKEEVITGYINVTVPKEVNKTLAVDVWNFGKTTETVVATENYANSGSALGEKKADKIVLSGRGEVELKELKLEAYEGKTDELIGLDVEVISRVINKKVETLNTTVLGNYKLAEVAVTYDVEENVNNDEILIDGVLYSDVKNSDYQFANLATLTFTIKDNADDTAVVGAKGSFAASAALEKPHMALVLDKNGDGIVDAICVDYYKLAEVKSASTVKNSKETYIKYATAELNKLATTDEILSKNIADAKELKKGDVFVYATINGVTYIDAVIAPVTADVEKIASETITLAGETGEVKYDDKGYFATSDTMSFDPTVLLASDAEAKDYYIYNGYVVFSTGSDVVKNSTYNYALLIYTEEPSDPVTDENNKIVIKYPAKIFVNGKQETVNVETIDGELTNTTKNNEFTLAEANAKAKANGGYPLYNYTLVTYEINKKTGDYIIKTVADTTEDFGERDDQGNLVLDNQGNPIVNTNIKVITAGTDDTKISYNPNSGLYALTTALDENQDGVADKYAFELNDDSIIYYTYLSKTNAKDKYLYYAFYNKANILAKFDEVTLPAGQQIFLVAPEKGTTYALAATLIDDELKAPASVAKRTWLNDARLIKYATADSIAEKQNGVGYYTYAFLDFATLANGSQVLDTATSIDDLALKATAGNFYAFNETTKLYEAIDIDADNDQDGNADCTSVQVGTITEVDVDRNNIYINGVAYTMEDGEVVDFALGYKLAAETLIFGAKGSKATEYTKFDLAALADLVEKAAEDANDVIAAIEAAVGFYIDEDGKLNIAWIIVDNYYEVEENDNITTKAAYDMIAKLAD